MVCIIVVLDYDNAKCMRLYVAGLLYLCLVGDHISVDIYLQFSHFSRKGWSTRQTNILVLLNLVK